MKTRNGFVSNSSSTSYIVYGWHISEKQMKDICLSSGYTQEDIDCCGYSEIADLMGRKDIGTIMIGEKKHGTYQFFDNWNASIGFCLVENGMKELQEIVSDEVCQKLRDMHPYVKGDPSLIEFTIHS